MEQSSIPVLIKVFLVLLGIGQVPAAVLQDFSLTSSSIAAGATDVIYTFEYTIVTANPYFVFYALANSNAIDTSAIGNPIDLDKVRVEINGISAAIDNSRSHNYGSGLYIRLRDPTLAKAGAHIKVELKGVSNRNTVGSFTWRWIRTATSGGWEVDGASNPAPLKFVAQHTTPTPTPTPTPVKTELQNFSWTLSNNAAGATNVTYTFEYTIVTANPYFVFYALAYSNAMNTTSIGNPIDVDKVRVEINGVPAAIDNRGQNSYNYGSGLFIRLRDPTLAKSGAHIKVELKGVSNRNTVGSFTWRWIRTATSGGWEVDGASNPAPLKFVAQHTTPSPTPSPTPVKTELQNFSWTLSNNAAAATNVTYTFEYNIVTANPYFVFYALAYNNAMNTSSIGNPIDVDKVRVEINGISAAIDNSRSYNYGSGLFIRLRDPTMAKTGAHIKVELKGVSNRNTIGTFRWRWIRTATGAGWEIDGVSNPAPLKFVAQHTTPTSKPTPTPTSLKTELQNFSWTLSNNAAGASNVTYTFEYTIVTANPYFVFYALAYNNAMNTRSIGNPIDLGKVRVEINGAPAAIDNRGQTSYNYGNGLYIRLLNPTLAKASAHIKVELKGVSNRNAIGSFRWQWIRTANRAGREVDGVSNPAPMRFVAQHTMPTSVTATRETTTVRTCGTLNSRLRKVALLLKLGLYY